MIVRRRYGHLGRCELKLIEFELEETANMPREVLRDDCLNER